MSMTPAALRFELDYLEVPAPKILLKPQIVLQNKAFPAMKFSFLNAAKAGNDL